MISRSIPDFPGFHAELYAKAGRAAVADTAETARKFHRLNKRKPQSGEGRKLSSARRREEPPPRHAPRPYPLGVPVWICEIRLFAGVKDARGKAFLSDQTDPSRVLRSEHAMPSASFLPFRTKFV